MLIMFELRFSKTVWSPESERKLKLMNDIAQNIEDIKFSLQCEGARNAWFGKHFIECIWADSNAKLGPDCCVCNDIKLYDYKFTQLFESLGSGECGEELYNRLMREIKGTGELEE